jgi:hypothetical protein
MKKVIRSIKSCALYFFVFMIIFFIGGRIYEFTHKDDRKPRTTPLNPQTITTLCKNFELDESDRLCNNTRDIYGPDFYTVLSKTLKPYEYSKYEISESLTYDDVEEKIGQFKYECWDVVHQKDGFSYFRCSYDLRGDSVYIVAILFSYPDNKVYRIMTPMGED